MFDLAVTSRSGRRKWYSLRAVRSVGLVSGTSPKRPNPTINPDARTVRRLSCPLENMKVTVQNGVAHGFSRRYLEAIIPLFPESWASQVQQIVLYQSSTPTLKVLFYPKERTLGVFWPMPVESISKTEGVQELLVALAVITERGELPKHLSIAVRERHLGELADLLQQCLTHPAMKG